MYDDSSTKMMRINKYDIQRQMERKQNKRFYVLLPNTNIYHKSPDHFEIKLLLRYFLCCYVLLVLRFANKFSKCFSEIIFAILLRN